MLTLKNITKDYHVGGDVVHALKNVNVQIHSQELTAILGQSGCGKTTLLNVIGGLDRADSGELLIDDISTEGYKAKDWDTYRNFMVGFVFQSYNLIPHMTVFKNVELALTLAGIDAKSRRALVMEALEKVGLLDQAKKRPNQLSGGQMQRVAIARAIVNKPKILLADEPTASVDSETSIQIMQVLKEISKEYAVIMVTHNEELASLYADRIIKMKDGEIIGDEKLAQPTTLTEEGEEAPVTVLEATPTVAPTTEKAPKRKTDKHASMSFITSLKLSLSNLISKKGRSLLTIIAGSISIVCIALILSMNTGFSSYIYNYENDSLTKYPIEITSENSSIMEMIQDSVKDGEIDMSSIDLNEMIGIFRTEEAIRDKYTDAELIYMEKTILGVFEKFSTSSGSDGFFNESGIKLASDISYFMNELDTNFNKDWGTVRKDYDLSLNIYSKSKVGYTQLNPFYNRMMEMVGSVGGGGVDTETQNELRSMVDSLDTWSIMIDDHSVLNSQYDVLAGHFPDYTTQEGMREIVLVVDEYNQIDDYVLFCLNKLAIIDLFNALTGQSSKIKVEYSFEDFIGETFTLMPSSDYYVYDAETGLYDFNDTTSNLDEKGLTLTVSGIVRLKENVGGGCIGGSIGYTQALAEYVINRDASSAVVNAQKQEYANYQAKLEQISALQKKMNDEGLTVEQLTPAEQLLLASSATLGIKSVVTGKTLTTNEYDQLMSVDFDVKDISKPSHLYVYPSSLEGKEHILNFLDAYNEKINSTPELKNSIVDYNVKYTDELSTMTASMSSMVNTITYILIAVAAIAVVVAMLLVAIILYISVQDRTKEIGILRSIGASKTNVASVFVAETFIIGLISGVVGVCLGLILMIPANYVVKLTLGITNLFVPVWWHEITLVALCFIITVLSGIIPSSIASKKDPVLALRTE